MPVLDKTSIAAFVRPAWENILASGARRHSLPAN